MDRPWLQSTADGVVLALHVQPGASRTEIVGEHGDALKIRLAAPPVDGKANTCLIEFLAACLGVQRAKVELLAGATGRRKRVRVHAVSRHDVERLLRWAGG